MPANTKQHILEIHEAAMRIVASFGIDTLDALDDDARPSVLVGLKKQLQADTDCTYQTAAKHIAFACHRHRSPEAKLAPKWGGAREGAGRPPTSGD